MSTFDPEQRDVDDVSESDNVDASVEKDSDTFLHSLITGGEEEIHDGRLIQESINHGITSFNPDTMFKNLVSDYKRAERLYGETVIKQVSGYDLNYIRKNADIPEFQRELRDKIQHRVDELEERDVLDDGRIADRAVEISSVMMYLDELDKLVLSGGGKSRKRRDDHGQPHIVRPYDNDPYRDFALRKTVQQAIRRGHTSIHDADMQAYQREREGRISVIYAMDASGSMKGDKLGMAKRAGVALTHKAIEENNDVGLVVFGTDVKSTITPCQNVGALLQELAGVTPGRETNIADTVDTAVELFRDADIRKHIVLLTDALPTKGTTPVDDTMRAVVDAARSGVTVSLVGINLNDEGRDVAQRIVDEGNGRLYTVDDSDNVDVLVLQDYEAL